MHRAVITLLVGLMLSLSGQVSASNVLPNASPEEQYVFALGRAMANDLEIAEAAFAEFPILNPGHPRVADSLFWLGRVQYLQQKFDLAAITFSEFNSTYPDDARKPDTTLWIAEAVSRFASEKDACAIYAELPNLLEAPPERLIDRLNALNEAANCDQFELAGQLNKLVDKDQERVPATKEARKNLTQSQPDSTQDRTLTGKEVEYVSKRLRQCAEKTKYFSFVWLSEDYLEVELEIAIKDGRLIKVKNKNDLSSFDGKFKAFATSAQQTAVRCRFKKSTSNWSN